MSRGIINPNFKAQQPWLISSWQAKKGGGGYATPEWDLNMGGLSNLDAWSRRCTLYRTWPDSFNHIEDFYHLPENCIIEVDLEGDGDRNGVADWNAGIRNAGLEAATRWARFCATLKKERPDITIWGYGVYPAGTNYWTNPGSARIVEFHSTSVCNDTTYPANPWEYTTLTVMRNSGDQTYSLGPDPFCIAGVPQPEPAWVTDLRKGIQADNSPQADVRFGCISNGQPYLDYRYMDCDVNYIKYSGHATCPDFTIPASKQRSDNAILPLHDNSPANYVSGTTANNTFSRWKNICELIYLSGGWPDYISMNGYIFGSSESYISGVNDPDVSKSFLDHFETAVGQLTHIAHRYGLKTAVSFAARVAPGHGDYNSHDFRVVAVGATEPPTITVYGDGTDLIGTQPRLYDMELPYASLMGQLQILTAVFNGTTTTMTYSVVWGDASSIDNKYELRGLEFDLTEKWMNVFTPYCDLLYIWEPPHWGNSYNINYIDTEMQQFVRDNKSRQPLPYERLKNA